MTMPMHASQVTWSHADPRLLTPPDLKHEHLFVHRLLKIYSPGPERDFLLFRHELLRVAANMRSGLKHSTSSSSNQREHPSPVALDDLRVIDDRYARALLIYERWVYVRQQRDIETIDLLFHSLMKRMPVESEEFYGQHTPWFGSSPGRYLRQYRLEHLIHPQLTTVS